VSGGRRARAEGEEGRLCGAVPPPRPVLWRPELVLRTPGAGGEGGERIRSLRNRAPFPGEVMRVLWGTQRLKGGSHPHRLVVVQIPIQISGHGTRDELNPLGGTELPVSAPARHLLRLHTRRGGADPPKGGGFDWGKDTGLEAERFVDKYPNGLESEIYKTMIASEKKGVYRGDRVRNPHPYTHPGNPWPC